MSDKDFSERSFDFLNYGVRGFAGTVVALYVVPSAVKRFVNNQLIFVEDKDSYSKTRSAGYGLGFLGGASVDVTLLDYIGEQTMEGNYTPAIALGLLNLGSALVEGVKLFKNRRKRLEEI